LQKHNTVYLRTERLKSVWHSSALGLGLLLVDRSSTRRRQHSNNNGRLVVDVESCFDGSDTLQILTSHIAEN